MRIKNVIRITLVVALVSLSSSATAALRVISLSPSTTDMMVELGASHLLVGLLSDTSLSAELKKIPSVGSYHRISIEKIVSLKPDLVLVWPDSISLMQRQQLIRLGIPLFITQPEKLDDLSDEFYRLGVRVGYKKQGIILQRSIKKRLTSLRETYRRAKPLRVFYQLWNDPLYTIGGSQIMSDALQVCGAKNIFSDISIAAPTVSVEAVITRNPDVILANNEQQLTRWKRWPSLRAVSSQQLIIISDKGLARPSYQMLNATEKLCKQLYSIPSAQK